MKIRLNSNTNLKCKSQMYTIYKFHLQMGAAAMTYLIILLNFDPPNSTR